MRKPLTSICLLFVFFIFFVGCNKPWQPWNAGPRWSVSLHKRQNTSSSYSRPAQRPIEDFCADNKEDVEQYRYYVLPEYDWNNERNSERRKKYIVNFINQYDEICNDE